MADLDQNTQNVIIVGGLAAILLLIFGKSSSPASGLAHGYSMAPMAATSACLPCEAAKNAAH